VNYIGLIIKKYRETVIVDTVNIFDKILLNNFSLDEKLKIIKI